MDRRTFLKRSGTAALGPLWARELWGAAKNLAHDAGTGDLRNATRVGAGIRRRRPSDANWPSQAAWKRLNDEVDGNLIPVEFPIEACVKDTGSAGCQNLFNNIHNPYYIGDQPGLTQTLGWVRHSPRSLRAFSRIDESACNPKPKDLRQGERNPFDVVHDDLANYSAISGR